MRDRIICADELLTDPHWSPTISFSVPPPAAGAPPAVAAARLTGGMGLGSVGPHPRTKTAAGVRSSLRWVMCMEPPKVFSGSHVLPKLFTCTPRAIDVT